MINFCPRPYFYDDLGLSEDEFIDKDDDEIFSKHGNSRMDRKPYSRWEVMWRPKLPSGKTTQPCHFFWTFSPVLIWTTPGGTIPETT